MNDRHARRVLPIPDHPLPALTTYDAKDPTPRFRGSTRSCRRPPPGEFAGGPGCEGVSEAIRFRQSAVKAASPRLSWAGERPGWKALCLPGRQADLGGQRAQHVVYVATTFRLRAPDPRTTKPPLPGYTT